MTEKEFKPLALKTESRNFNYGDDKVALSTIVAFFDMIEDVDKVADTLKKALYYKPKDASARDTNIRHQDIFDPYLDSDHSTKIVELVSTHDLHNKVFQRLFHAVLGKMTEAFEMLAALKGPMLEGRSFDRTNFKEEVADDQWYNSIIMDVLKLDNLDDLRAMVIDKLAERYPNKFSDHNAENRDLNAERKILENHANNKRTEA